ncbi:hypothetical protein CEUSTIGMA_g8283.t1 [Chlamydomonas eustigma]|uniref:Uncharacterized protein n=1 Tax=Chlamydomonas eustigma TaxID=1157962 RepID=A0A250XCN6_9CHLO|nr:hypothetical protein CEUSTIGMA_g8283.t1 [Chlamydomonas eustigma]|eukprot:GAX80848.1 hypothetical protein CEUSTIGMA_g8283.t1 [Chlamydomonas eustigma]
MQSSLKCAGGYSGRGVDAVPRVGRCPYGLSRALTLFQTSKTYIIKSSTDKANLSADGSKQQPSIWDRILPPIAAKDMLTSTWSMLQSCFWPILLIYALKDAAAFVLHRMGHRLTNLGAECILGPLPSITNTWWLNMDSTFLEGNLGYQAMIAVFFLLCLPLNIALNSYAMSASMEVLRRSKEKSAATPVPAAQSASNNASAHDVVNAEAEVPEAAHSATPASTSGLPISNSTVSSTGPTHNPGMSIDGSSSSGYERTLSNASTSTNPRQTDIIRSSSDEAAAGPQHSDSSDASSSASEGQSVSSQAGTEVSGSKPRVDQVAPPSQPPLLSKETTSQPGGSWSERVASMLGFGAKNQSSEPSQAGDKTSSLESGSGTAVTQPSKSLSLIQTAKDAIQEVLAVAPTVNGMLQRVWWVDVLFNVRALPLQALSLLVLPLPYTLPMLLAIQLAVPCAIAEGHSGMTAIQRSQQLMTGFGHAYAWPFVSIIVGIRIVDVVRNLILASLPPRFWQEIIEIPVILIGLFGFTKLVIIRLQDLIPLAAYYIASSKKTELNEGVNDTTNVAVKRDDAVPSPSM